jgi:hypothetical protein
MTYHGIYFKGAFAEARLRSRGSEARNLGFGSLNYSVLGGQPQTLGCLRR